MRTVAILLVLGLLSSGCGSGQPGLRDAAPAGPRGFIELGETPFFPQDAHQCGPAALATILAHAGAQTAPETLAGQVYVPGRRGSLQVELLGATRRQGLVPYPIAPGLDAIVSELGAGRPVLVLMGNGPTRYPVWHYAVVIGHDPSTGSVILRSGSTRRKLMPERRFLAAWARGGSWGLVALRPGELPAKTSRTTYLAAVAALEAVGQYGSAELAYRAALAHWPDDPTALLGIGNSLYGQGDKAGAEGCFRRLIRRHPEALPAYNNLAQLLAERGRRGQALAILAKGLSRTPADHPLRSTLESTRDGLNPGGAGSGMPHR